jgi:hypothetical protein
LGNTNLLLTKSNLFQPDSSHIGLLAQEAMRLRVDADLDLLKPI